MIWLVFLESFLLFQRVAWRSTMQNFPKKFDSNNRSLCLLKNRKSRQRERFLKLKHFAIHKDKYQKPEWLYNLCGNDSRTQIVLDSYMPLCICTLNTHKDMCIYNIYMLKIWLSRTVWVVCVCVSIDRLRWKTSSLM